ncbi:hypothetical protein V9L05_01320 [Bernardetia sp. Wsw4-3y2]|uniref:hypothetical protein n=1 Tax=Bernardetia sp. Wsw4-3y2 TaxID=3127471 RepID=UPI0030D3C047
MNLQVIENALNALLLSFSAKYLVFDTLMNVSTATVTTVDLVDLASKLSVVALLLIGVYFINRERNTLTDKMEKAYKELIAQKNEVIDLKNKSIEEANSEKEYWKDKYLALLEK